MKKKPKVLQLCSYYISNKLYSHLFSELAGKVEQTAYIPIKKKSLHGVNSIKAPNLELQYSEIVRPYHKYLYGRKIRKQKKDLCKLIGNHIYDISLIHAHTLFSDGGTAYLLKKKYKIPYILNVRNTDINSFYKYAVHYRRFAHKVLLNSKAVVFISHAYKDRTLNVLSGSLRKEIEKRSYVIPNGIVQDYFEPIEDKKDKNNSALKLITIASLDKNKNVGTKIKLVKELNEQGLDVQLEVIGSGPLHSELESLSKQLGVESKVRFLGYLGKNEIRARLDNSDIFILTSYKETFGIAYIEALARGLPIIYTRGQGVDGFFQSGEVGFSVEPTNLTEMQSAIKKIQQDYKPMSSRCRKVAADFSWEKVAVSYLELYSNFERNDKQI